jgi:hypothetical protein
VRSLGFGFVTHGDAGVVQEVKVEGGTEGGAAWETGCGRAVEELGASDAIGAVGETERGNPVGGEGECVPEVSSCEGGLVGGVVGKVS